MSDSNAPKRNADSMEDMDEEFSFSFSAPMQELHEIAIISIAGGTNVPLAERAYKRRSEIQANNKQELAGEVLRALDINKKEIGVAVEQRSLHVLGHDKPWSIDICTTRTAEPLYCRSTATSEKISLKLWCLTLWLTAWWM